MILKEITEVATLQFKNSKDAYQAFSNRNKDINYNVKKNQMKRITSLLCSYYIFSSFFLLLMIAIRCSNQCLAASPLQRR